MTFRGLTNSAVTGVTISLVLGGLCSLPVVAQDCPELVGRWPYGRANAVAVSGDYAYFGSGLVLMIADVSDPATSQIMGEVVLADSMSGLVVSGDYAYVGDNYSGLRVIDISSPSSPTEVGFFDTPGNALDVAISADHVYVADGSSGMAIFRKCASGCTPISIAAAASGPGAGDSLWATDLGINNSGAEILTYKFQLLPRGEDTTDAAFLAYASIVDNGTGDPTTIWPF